MKNIKKPKPVESLRLFRFLFNNLCILGTLQVVTLSWYSQLSTDLSQVEGTGGGGTFLPVKDSGEEGYPKRDVFHLS